MSETNNGDIVAKRSQYTLGIDLGTTNTCVSVYYGGQMKVIPLMGKQTMPSVVRFADRQTDSAQVGDTARKYLIIKPNEVFSSVKSLMRNDDWKDDPQLKEKFTFNGELITPTEIAAKILSEARNEAQRWENADGNFEKVVICVPANSTPIYKNNVREAAIAAGFGETDQDGTLKRNNNGDVEGIYLIEEPTAASLAYGVTKGFFNPNTHKEQNILVYDLGGGTFDVTILHIVTNQGSALPQFTPIATKGVAKLGGDDFDWALASIIAKKIQEETGIDILSDPTQIGNKSILKFACEDLKIQFANGANEVIFDKSMSINKTDYTFDFVITNSEFIKSIQPLIEKTLECVKDAITSSKLSVDDIDRIVLVGGSSKAPWIKEAIKGAGYKEPYTAENVDTIVSQGAAYFGSNLVGTGGCTIITPVLPHHYGVELNDGTFSPLFEKGTEYESELSASSIYYNPDESGRVIVTAWATQQNIDIDSDSSGRKYSETLVSARDDDGNPLFEWIGEVEVKVPRKPAGKVEVLLQLTINEQKEIHATATVDGIPTEAFWKHN